MEILHEDEAALLFMACSFNKMSDLGQISILRECSTLRAGVDVHRLPEWPFRETSWTHCF